MTGISSEDSPFFDFCVVIITKVNMIKDQELVNFQGTRLTGFLRVAFYLKKEWEGTMNNCKYQIYLMCYLQENSTKKIVRKLTADVSNDIQNAEGFRKELDRIKVQYKNKYNDGSQAIIVRPFVAERLARISGWLSSDNAKAERHICTCVFVRDKDDPEFLWPVISAGIDIKDENRRAIMLESCKEISLSYMKGSGRNCYVDSDIHIIRTVEDKRLVDDMILLCQKEESCCMEKDAFRIFLEPKRK